MQRMEPTTPGGIPVRHLSGQTVRVVDPDAIRRYVPDGDREPILVPPRPSNPDYHPMTPWFY